ncbi:MAG: ABC transporter substrate-binding protein [Clostridia bacterium]
MQAALYFLELRAYFSGSEVNKPFPVPVEKLSGIWHCTPRYAKLLVRNLCEQGWIEWKAGRGRGHLSQLTLLTGGDEILLREVKQKIEQGNVQEAMEFMNRFGSAAIKDEMIDWLSEGMGFSTQAVSDRLQDTLRLPVYRTILTLDPGMVYYTFDAHMTRQLFNTLVDYDHERGMIVPGIAHSWEMSSDAREWTFHLRKSVLFHHGRELTAHDVMFSLDRMRLNTERFESSWMFQDIEQIEAIDYKTVRIHLRASNYLFLQFLCTTFASIVPEDVVRNDEAGFGQRPIGTGPFRLVRHNDGICILEAFPAHFRGRPHLDRVEVLIFPNVEAGRLKEPDWMSVMNSQGDTSKEQREVLGNQEAEWCDLETLFSCCSLLVFNQRTVGPQNQLKFRQALHHIIDRERMVAELGGDRISPAYSFRPSRTIVDQGSTGGVHLTRTEIEELVQASGYRSETFRLVTTAYHEADAVWIRERCKEFGIHLEINVRPHAEFANDALPDHDGQLYGNVFSHDEVSELEMYLQNNYFFSAYDRQTAAAVKEATALIFREPDWNGRQQKLAELEAYMQQTYSVLYLVQKKTNTSFHKSVRDVTINSFGWLDFYKIWIQPQART